MRDKNCKPKFSSSKYSPQFDKLTVFSSLTS